MEQHGGSPIGTSKKGKRRRNRNRSAASFNSSLDSTSQQYFDPMVRNNSPMNSSGGGFVPSLLGPHNGPSHGYQDYNNYQHYGPNGPQQQNYNGGPNYNNANYNNGQNYNMTPQNYNMLPQQQQQQQQNMSRHDSTIISPTSDKTQKSPDGPGPSKKAKLSEATVTAAVMKERIRTVPYRVSSCFVGRQTELKLINNATQACHTFSIDVAILGPVGCGKTQLALKFIEENSSDFHHIIWISWESVDKTQKYFQTLASELQIQSSSIKEKTQFQTMMSRIFNTLCRQKTILVFDNVDMQSSLLQFLPTSDVHKIPNMFTLVTSQYNNWESNIKIILDVFPYTSCLDFIKLHLTSNREGDFKDLCELLDCSPVGLQIAVNIIKKNVTSQNRSFKIDDFIEKYHRSDNKTITDMLKYEDKFTNKTLFTTFEFLFRQLKTKAFADTCMDSKKACDYVIHLLSLLCLIDNENITESMFHSKLLGGSEEQCTESLLLLENFFLIKYRGDKIIISKFLQKVIFIILSERHEDNIIKLLTMFEKDIDTNKRYPKFSNESYALHAMKLWNETNLNEDLVKCFSKIPVAIVYTYWNCVKNFNTSSALFLMLEEKLGYGHVDFLQFINVITNVENPNNLVNIQNSITFCENSISKIPKELCDHKDVLKLTFKLALLYNYMDQLDESWKILEELYKKQCDKIGIDNEDTLETLEKMSEISMKIFKKSGKSEIIESCLSYIFQRFSNVRLDHVKSLCMMKYIPQYLHDSNKDEEALKLYDCLYETLETVNGSADSFTLETLMAKGQCLNWLQQYDKAWDVIIQLNTQQIINKIDNSRTISILCKISNDIREDRKSKCWDFCFSLIDDRIINKSKQQTDQEQTLQILQDAMYLSKDYSKLLQLFDKFYLTLSYAFTHPLLQKSTYAKIDCLILNNQFENAWDELMKLHKQQIEHQLDTSRTLVTLCQVACEYGTDNPLLIQDWILMMNQITNFEVVLMILEKIVSLNSPKTMRVLSYYDKLLKNLKTNHGVDSPPTLRTQLGKAWHMWCLDQKEAAWALYIDVCRVVKLKPEQKTTRRWEFCNSLSKLITVIKDMS